MLKVKKSYILIILILFEFFQLITPYSQIQDSSASNEVNELFISDIISPLWTLTYGTAETESGYSLAIDSSDNLFLMGKSNNPSGTLLVKYNKMGVQYWNISVPGWGQSIAIDSSDNICITGYKQVGNRQMYLIKLNNSGSLLWDVTWGGTGWEDGRAIAIDFFDNIYVTGRGPGPGSSVDMFIIKFDKFGSILWEKTWGGYGNDFGKGIAVDSANNVYVGGFTYSYDYRGDNFLIKYKSNGVKMWEITHGGSNYDNSEGITVDSQNNIYHVGYTEKSGNIDYMRLTKFDNQGTILWIRDFNSGGHGFGVAVDSFDNVYVAGSQNGDIDIVKYDRNGNYLGQNTWGGSLPEYLFSSNCISVDSSDDVYISGTTNSYGAGRFDMFLIKYDGSVPDINIIAPLENHLYGPIAPEFNVEIFDGNIDKMWYTINGSHPEMFVSNGTFRQNIWNSLSNGTNSITFYANDTVGNIGTSSIKVNVDKLAPNITINSPEPYDLFDNRTISFNISIFDGNLEAIWYSLNDNLNYTLLETVGFIEQEAWDACGNGTVSIKFFANDSIGNIELKEITVYKDVNLPIISINKPISSQFYKNETFAFELDIIGNDINKTWYTLNNGIEYLISGTSGIIDQSAWNVCDNGTVTLQFFANNSDGNIATNSVLVYKDMYSPQITINSPFPFQLFGNETLYFELIIDEPNLDDTWYSLNGGLNHTFTNLSGLINQTAWNLCGNGTVVIKFYANDTAGNLAFKEVIVQKDINLPVILVNSPESMQLFGNNTIAFALVILGKDIDKTWYTLNNGMKYIFSGTDGIINQTVWDLCGNGTVSIKFYVNDSMGKLVIKEVIVKKDIFPPQITIISPIANQQFGNETIYFELNIDEPNLNNTWYSLNGGLNHLFTNLSGIIDQTAWDLCGNGTISIKFYAIDLVGNSRMQEINIQKDIHYPIITIISPVQNNIYGTLAIQFELLVNEPYLDTIWYSLNGGTNFTVPNHLGRIDQSEWDSCSNGTVYIKFYVNNTAGNISFEEITILKDLGRLAPREAYAIVIGIEDYQGDDSDLEYSRDDALAMYSFLIYEYNYKPENIILLLDSDATNSGINNAFSQINNKITSEDVFLFYFSGHGGADTNWGEYILPYDSINPFNPSHIYFDYVLEARIDNLNVDQKYVIIDSCNSGGFIDEIQATGSYIITSCRDYELSYEASDLAHGIFTYYFLQSLEQATDSNGDGVISFEEQFPYAYTNTRVYSNYNSYPQQSDGITGQSVLFPSLGDVYIDLLGNQFNYSFYIYGHGLIKTINILVGSVSGNLTLISRDLKKESSSYSGFGYYSGGISIDSNDTITGYEVLIEIEGYNDFTFYQGYGDTDGDGLYDTVELLNGINPLIIDTDFDGLTDFEEFYGVTNPLNNDTDSDGLNDGEEVNIYFTNPNEVDSDYDGLNDVEEVNIYTTNPNDADSDGDGLDDGEEVNFYFTNPNNDDSDDDRMPDSWEVYNSLNPLVDDSTDDPDNDNLQNFEEYTLNTNPNDADSDNDGWNDGDEVNRGTDPTDPNDFPSTTKSVPGYHLISLLWLIIAFAIISYVKMSKKILK
ncbi:hypothetical protein LCGC14_0786310 [marine sediment metagenome]|uniref:Peptidase C14 caspase domain-containing protein n=1 Tax=marine sediment metagenome TaxID=412755 RepID=A0A0F9PY86_9ZZZZ